MRRFDVSMQSWRAGSMLLATLCMMLAMAGVSRAQFADPAFDKPSTTVAEARTARVHSRVSLTGSLKQEISRANYLFRDATGDIRVRIEREFWQGREITNRTVLNLRGRVDSDVRGRFIDVYYFRIVD